MPSLPSKKFQFKNKAGDELNFTSTVTVDSEGIFRMTIPVELEEVAHSALKGNHDGVSINQSPKTLGIYAKTLDTCRKYIAIICNEYLECDVTTENMILYATDIKVSYCKVNDTFYPNGRIAGENYKWYGKLSATYPANYFTIGIAARIYEKKTFKRALSTKIEYKSITTDHTNKGTYFELLNGICGLYINTTACKEMPYTEEAAKFFYETMMSMCKLADRLETFFSDEDNIHKAITNNSSFLQLQ